MEDVEFLCTVDDYSEALVISSILEGASIRYETFSVGNMPFSFGMTTHLSFASPLAPISFYVYKDDCEKAKELLNELGLKP